jgi:heme exporter protein A
LSQILVNELSFFRRDTWLVLKLSLTVSSGECWLLTGPNGSGKTTFLRILTGLSVPDEGNVTYPSGDPSFLYIASPPAKIPELSVLDNLRFQALMHWGTYPDKSLLIQSLACWDIESLIEQPLSSLSQGQQQRVALSLLLLGPANIWLLDEPTIGLDAAGITSFWALCRQHQARGGSLIVATHQEPDPPMAGLRRLQLGVSTPNR